jgi:hypothetical protein
MRIPLLAGADPGGPVASGHGHSGLTRPGAILVLAAAFAATMLLCTPESAAATGTKPALVKAVVLAKKVRTGDLFTVDLRARRMRGVSTIAFHVVYDPAMLAPVTSGFSEGPLLGEGEVPTAFLARAASTADRVVVGVARLGTGGSKRAKGLLCRMTFRALAEGAADLAFDRAQVTDPSVREVPAVFQPASLVVLPPRSGAGD